MNDVNQDKDYLRMLSIFHYVLGGICALGASLFIIHVALGILILVSPQAMSDEGGTFPPEFAGWLFMAVGSLVVLLGWVFALCIIIAGRSLVRMKNYIFCMVMAIMCCLIFPLGTVLGVFTLIILLRPSVKELFGNV